MIKVSKQQKEEIKGHIKAHWATYLSTWFISSIGLSFIVESILVAAVYLVRAICNMSGRLGSIGMEIIGVSSAIVSMIIVTWVIKMYALMDIRNDLGYNMSVADMLDDLEK